MKRHLILVMVMLAVLVSGELPQAAQFKTKEEVLAHLTANSPYRGSWIRHRDPRVGPFIGHLSATFTREGGYLHISQTIQPADGEIKDLEIILKDDKITLTFINSNTLARYKLELKHGKLVGIAESKWGESDIELAPHPTK